MFCRAMHAILLGAQSCRVAVVALLRPAKLCIEEERVSQVRCPLSANRCQVMAKIFRAGSTFVHSKDQDGLPFFHKASSD